MCSSNCQSYYVRGLNFGDRGLLPKEEAESVKKAFEAQEKLKTAIRWLRRLEKEFPGCLNEDAIDKHLS